MAANTARSLQSNQLRDNLVRCAMEKTLARDCRAGQFIAEASGQELVVSEETVAATLGDAMLVWLIAMDHARLSQELRDHGWDVEVPEVGPPPDELPNATCLSDQPCGVCDGQRLVWRRRMRMVNGGCPVEEPRERIVCPQCGGSGFRLKPEYQLE